MHNRTIHSLKKDRTQNGWEILALATSRIFVQFSFSENVAPLDQSANAAMLMYQYAKMLQFSPESNQAHEFLGQLDGRAQVWQAFEKLAREAPDLTMVLGPGPDTAQPAKPAIRFQILSF